jgi:phosphocarrier protein
VKLTKTITIKNSQGLHLRPAALIVKILRACRSRVFFTCQNKTVDARSIMGLLTLVAQKNQTITIVVEGEDGKQTMEALTGAFKACFGEEAVF